MEIYNQCSYKPIKPLASARIEEMLDIMQPVAQFVINNRTRYRRIEIDGVDRRSTAYTWSPRLGTLVKHIDSPLNYLDIVSLHTWGYYGFFKPSLAEVLSAIYHNVEGWEHLRFFELRPSLSIDTMLVGNYHQCICRCYGPEQWNVIDDCWAKDVDTCNEIIAQERAAREHTEADSREATDSAD